MTSRSQKTQNIKLTKRVSIHFRKTQTTELARRVPFGFFNIHYGAKHQKTEGGPIGELFSNKSHNAKKIERWPFNLTRYCMLRGKKGQKPFWFSSLGQMVQFDTIKFRRTL